MTTSSAAERAYETIRDDILTGRHRPGAMLGEAALAAALGVSRTPVRAALVRLQDEGWIEIYPKRGALVQGLSPRQAAEHADARLILETTAIGRVSTAQRDGYADALDESIAHQVEAFRASDVRSFIDLTLAFHRGFVRAAQSDVLLELYDRLADRHRYLLFALGDGLLERCEEIIAEHRELTSCLRTGDARGFATALRDHIGETAHVDAPDPSLTGLFAVADGAGR